MANNFDPRFDLLAAMPAPIYSKNVKIATGAQVVAINTALVNSCGTFRDNAADGIATAITQNNFQFFLNNLIFTLADTGTSENTDFSAYKVTIRRTTPAGGAEENIAIPLDRLTNVIKLTTTVRRYCRYYAFVVFSRAKANGLEFAIGRKAGVPTKFKHVGFDFADGLKTKHTSDEEEIAIDNAKQILLYRSAQSVTTNTSTQYHPGVTGASAGAPRGLIANYN